MIDLANGFKCKPARIYNHFENKKEILFEVFREEMVKIVAPVDRLEDDNSQPQLDQLLFFTKSHVNVVLGHRRSCKMLFDTELPHLRPDKREVIIDTRKKYDGILCNIVERRVKTGESAPMTSKPGTCSIASFIARSRVWYPVGGSLTPDQIGEFIFDFGFSGLEGQT